MNSNVCAKREYRHMGSEGFLSPTTMTMGLVWTLIERTAADMAVCVLPCIGLLFILL
jgi:hypothetical protein